MFIYTDDTNVFFFLFYDSPLSMFFDNGQSHPVRPFAENILEKKKKHSRREHEPHGLNKLVRIVRKLNKENKCHLISNLYASLLIYYFVGTTPVGYVTNNH